MTEQQAMQEQLSEGPLSVVQQRPEAEADQGLLAMNTQSQAKIQYRFDDKTQSVFVFFSYFVWIRCVWGSFERGFDGGCKGRGQIQRDGEISGIRMHKVKSPKNE